MTTEQITTAAQNLINAIANDQHTAQQQDLIRLELGVYAEDATQEQIEALINQALDGGFDSELEILTA